MLSRAREVERIAIAKLARRLHRPVTFEVVFDACRVDGLDIGLQPGGFQVRPQRVAFERGPVFYRQCVDGCPVASRGFGIHLNEECTGLVEGIDRGFVGHDER